MYCPQCGTGNEGPARFCRNCAAVLFIPQDRPVADVRSRFDGGVLGFIGVQIGSALLMACTLGLALPWVVTWRQRWITNHSVISGRRLHFTGTGAGLGWRWLMMWLLIIITFGIYGFWAWIYVQRWIVEHTEFAT